MREAREVLWILLVPFTALFVASAADKDEPVEVWSCDPATEACIGENSLGTMGPNG